MVNDHLAKEAARLMADEIFLKTMAAIRSDALNELAKAVADDKTMILRLQQKVAVIDEIRNGLDRYIIAAVMQEDAGSFA
jgi:hypothetical protein